MYVDFHQDCTITFWDIWYSKFSYFTKSFSLSHDNWRKIILISLKFNGDVKFVYYLLCVLRIQKFVYELQRYLRLKLIYPLFESYFSGTALCIPTRKWKWRVPRVRVIYLLLFFIEVNLQRASPIHELS